MLKRMMGIAALLCLLAPAVLAQAPAPGAARVTAMYTTWDDYYFYAGFQVRDPNVISVNTTPTSQPQQDDDIEVFFETDNARATVRSPHTYQMAVSAGNGAYFSVGDGTKIPKAKVVYTYKYAAVVDGTLNNPADTDVGYSIELAIPWQELGQPGPPRDGTTWGFNVISRDRDSAAAPAARFFSLSPLVKSGADVQNPSKWSHITFSTGDVPAQSVDAVASPHTTLNRFPSINGSVVSGEWPSASRLAFGTAAINAPAPTVAEEPNTTESPFSAPPPGPPAPSPNTVPEPPRPQPPVPRPPRTAQQPAAPTSIDLPNGGSIKIVPGGIKTPTDFNPPNTVASAGPFTNPLAPRVPEKLQPAFQGNDYGQGIAPPLGPNVPPRLVVALYRLDYNGDNRKAPGQNVWDAGGASLLVDQPMNGCGPWFSGLRPLWHRQQLTDMRRAGIEVALLQVRDNDPLLGREADALVEALKEMKAAGQDYPLVGEAPDGPLTTPTLRNHIPEEFRADRGVAEAANRVIVSPGGVAEGSVAARADGKSYHASWQQALASKPDTVVINSWNDFTRGTEIAASRQYGERYADDTRLATIAFNGNRQWHAKYLKESVPRTILPKTLYQIPIRIENAGTLPWRAGEGYSLCTRWYTSEGRIADDSAPRIPIGKDVLPGQSITLSVGLVARNGYGDDLEPGDYVLVVDMVQGQNKWFSYAGDNPLQVPVHVVAAGDPGVRPRATFLGTTTPTAGQAGGTYRPQVDVRNDGPAPWTGNRYALSCKFQQVAEDGTATTVGQMPGQPLSPVAIVPGQVMPAVPHLALADGKGRPLPPGEYRLRWFVQAGDGTSLPGTYDEWLTVVAADPGASFVLSDIPREMEAGKETTAKLAVQNLSGGAWAKGAQRVGYHWYYLDGTEAQWDGGLLSPFTKDVPPGRADGDIVAKVRAPQRPGRYSLAWDVQRADGSWASVSPASKGTDLLQAIITVTGRGDVAPVDLRKEYNGDGIGPDGDFDGRGHALPAEMLPPDGTAEVDINSLMLADQSGGKPGPPLYPDGYYAGRADHAVPFLYPDNAKPGNVVVCRGQTLSLPGGNYRAVHLLAAGGGSTVNAAFGLAGGSQSLTIADWAAPAGATPGFRSPYMVGRDGDAATPITLGDYVLRLDPSQRVDRLTLPDAPAVKIVAITLER
ncbi:MAG: hypothetical protein JO250_08055 [Armatimonadetes bacterium]|nr:hypothetical protein [Armatimonadota bacterium]